MARLIIRREGEDRTISIPPEAASFVIGRAPGCDLVIDDTASSRRHCAIERTGDGQYRLADLKSSNGTRLNGARVESSGLKDGDAIQIGNDVIRFHADAADVAEIVLDEPEGGATFVLRLRGGDRDGEAIPLPPGRHTVGRAGKNAIAIDATGVSGVHAEIKIDGFTAHVKDLGSTNGTFVNGTRVTDSPLSHGDTVRFGGQSAAFLDSARANVEASSEESVPLVDSVSDSDVPRRRGGLWAMAAFVLLLGGGAAAYVYVPRLFPATGARFASARKPVHAATNHVPAEAFSFEGETAGTLWRVRGEGTPAGSRIGESESVSGLASLSLSAPDSRAKALAVELAEPVSISSARHYRLAAKVRGTGVAGVAGVLIAWVGPGGEISLDASDAMTVASGEWTEIAVAAAPPRGASHARPVLFVAGGGAAALFDDVVLEEAGDASAPIASAYEFTAAESGARGGSKGDVSLSRGVRGLLHDLEPVVVEARAATEDGASAPIELTSVHNGAVESSRGDAAVAEWRLELRGGPEPVTLTETLEPLPNGFRIAYSWPRGARSVEAVGITAKLDAALEPVFMVVGAGGSVVVEGEFSESNVRDVIVGRVAAAAGQADPFRLRFSSPLDVRVRREDDGSFRLTASAAPLETLDVVLQTSFVEERNRAAALRDAVKKAEASKSWGEALARAEEILNDLPFHEGAIEEATRVTTSLRERGEAEAKRLEDELRDVEFLPTEATVGALATAAASAARAWTGTRFADRAQAVAAACATRRDAMARGASEGFAERLRRRAADLEASGKPALANLLREAAERRAESTRGPAGDESDGGGY